jgi:plasmid stabilization system protein ParE
MAKKRIIWSKRAELELRSILVYYNERNGNTKYSLKIVDTTEKLLDFVQEGNYLGRLSDNKT